jgi:hypothetical protein
VRNWRIINVLRENKRDFSKRRSGNADRQISSGWARHDAMWYSILSSDGVAEKIMELGRILTLAEGLRRKE